jgi:hypothetical protein
MSSTPTPNIGLHTPQGEPEPPSILRGFLTVFGKTRKVMQSEAMHPSSFGWFAYAQRRAVPPEHCRGIPYCIWKDGLLDINYVHFIDPNLQVKLAVGEGCDNG